MSTEPNWTILRHRMLTAVNQGRVVVTNGCTPGWGVRGVLSTPAQCSRALNSLCPTYVCRVGRDVLITDDGSALLYRWDAAHADTRRSVS